MVLCWQRLPRSRCTVQEGRFVVGVELIRRLTLFIVTNQEVFTMFLLGRA